ncbi:hypothetical protein OF83DRAFT_1081564 [Amylostereum chailletii]|nr:hypothetical protein OF83DRAFT_1081564 [Amylostereum chailletii]
MDNYCISPALLEGTSKGRSATRRSARTSTGAGTKDYTPSPLSNVLSAKSPKRTSKNGTKSAQASPAKRANKSPTKKTRSPRKQSSPLKSTASSSSANSFPVRSLSAPPEPLYYTNPSMIIPGICGEAVGIPFADDLPSGSEWLQAEGYVLPVSLPVDLDWELGHMLNRRN